MKLLRLSLIPWILVGVLAAGLRADDDGLLRRDVLSALRKAGEFFRARVAAGGGYLWRYSEDLRRREGEGRAAERTVWVQPPGTPSVGMAFLETHRATGESRYLDAARETAGCLMRGQLLSGGWDNRIELDPQRRRRYAYRVDGETRGRRNVSTLDDDNTQAALRFLMRVDRALKFGDEAIHESVSHALNSLLVAQYPNGAWPQRFERPPAVGKFPVRKASYPSSWSRSHPGRDYKGYYTFNDNTILNMIETMFEAWGVYGDARYREASEKAGDFILLARMPEPQPAWAQQYDSDMHPAWARKFEPPAISGGESQGVMRALLSLYRETGKEKYLAPLPVAIDYFRRSLLPDGRLARFYELRTNRPLYFTRSYEITYSDADPPTHYAFKVDSSIEGIARDYRYLRDAGPFEKRKRREAARPELTDDLRRRVRAVIEALDAEGRWVEDGRLRYHGPDDPTTRVIQCGTFVRNMNLLSSFIEATDAKGKSLRDRRE